MYYANTTAAHHAALNAAEAMAEELDALFPDWQTRELYGIRYLSPTDFDLSEDSADAVPNEDWDWFIEATYSDRMEWEDR